MAIFLIPGLIIIALACLVYIQLHLSKAEEENKIKLDHDKSLCIDHQIQIALLKLVKYLTLVVTRHSTWVDFPVTSPSPPSALASMFTNVAAG